MSQSAPRRPVLLLGGSGFLGKALESAIGEANAFSTHFSDSRAGAGSLRFDAASTRVESLLRDVRVRPAAAVLLFANSNIDQCARHPSETRQLNVTAACRVIDELVGLQILPVFISSDAVFDGSRSWYEEEDVALPILTYGKQKLEVERHLAAKSNPWLAMRLPKLISEKADPRCMITSWVKDLAAGEDIRCATDQFFTPAAVADVAGAIDSLLDGAGRGMFHLAGPDRMSRRQLLEVVLDEYRLHAPLRSRVVDCSLKDFDFAEARPLDTSMRSERAKPLLRSGFRGLEQVARAAVRACLKRRA